MKTKSLILPILFFAFAFNGNLLSQTNSYELFTPEEIYYIINLKDEDRINNSFNKRKKTGIKITQKHNSFTDKIDYEFDLQNYFLYYGSLKKYEYDDHFHLNTKLHQLSINTPLKENHEWYVKEMKKYFTLYNCKELPNGYELQCSNGAYRLTYEKGGKGFVVIQKLP